MKNKDKNVTKNISVLVTKEEYEQIKKSAIKDDRALSAFIRNIVKNHLSNNDKYDH